MFFLLSERACVCHRRCVAAGLPPGANSYTFDNRVISVLVKAGFPVAVKMAPVLRLEVELDVSTHEEVFSARAHIVSGIAASLEIEPSLVRFIGTLPGSLPLTRIAVIDVQPPPFPCTIPEMALLSYCTSNRFLQPTPFSTGAREVGVIYVR
jgi:hypothetical protein